MLVSNKRFYPLTEEMSVTVKQRSFLFHRVEDETDTGRLPDYYGNNTATRRQRQEPIAKQKGRRRETRSKGETNERPTREDVLQNQNSIIQKLFAYFAEILYLCTRFPKKAVNA